MQSITVEAVISVSVASNAMATASFSASERLSVCVEGFGFVDAWILASTALDVLSLSVLLARSGMTAAFIEDLTSTVRIRRSNKQGKRMFSVSLREPPQQSSSVFVYDRGILRPITFMEVTVPTLEQIQTKMLKLQNQADALIAKGAQAALDQIRRIMLEHGLTTEDIEAKAKAKRDAKSTNEIAPKVKGKVAAPAKEPKSPKYLHPKTGATWTGHGRAPAWIATVKDRSKFLNEGGAKDAPAASERPVSKAKTVAKKASKVVSGTVAHRGQRTGPQPAKYRDPKSGASWSGKGPAPAWLAAVKDRSKYLIDGVIAVAPDATTGSKVGKSKSSGSGTIEKKAAAKKVVAKKAISAKVATGVAEAEPTI